MESTTDFWMLPEGTFTLFATLFVTPSNSIWYDCQKARLHSVEYFFQIDIGERRGSEEMERRVKEREGGECVFQETWKQEEFSSSKLNVLEKWSVCCINVEFVCVCVLCVVICGMRTLFLFYNLPVGHFQQPFGPDHHVVVFKCIWDHSQTVWRAF